MSTQNITETIKAKLDELDIDRRVDEAVAQAQAAWTEFREMAGGLAAEHGDKVESFLAKVTTEIDTRTEGKYAEQVGRVREQVSTGVAKLAEQRKMPDFGPTDSDTGPQV